MGKEDTKAVEVAKAEKDVKALPANTKAPAKSKTAKTEKTAKSAKKVEVTGKSDKPEVKKTAKPTKTTAKQLPAGEIKKPAAKSASKPAPRKSSGKTVKIDVVDVSEPKAEAKPKAKEETKPKDEPAMKLPKVRKLHFRIGQILCALVVVVLAVFFGRVAIWEHGYFERMEGSERDVTDVNIEGDADYDPVEPTEVEVVEYHVAPGMPRYFTISSVGINRRRMVEIGILPTGELDSPYNIWNVGWYNGSPLPGEGGTSIIDAHGGAHGIAAFGNLPEVNVGDIVEIEMEPLEGETEGVVYRYQITDTATKAIGDEANDYMADLAFVSPAQGVSSITMITCTGVYYQASHTYSHRFFARAVLVTE